MDENNINETLHTWNKFANSARKAGFRDGATSGRDSVFQKSFDDGYSEGIKNGMAIGKYKGAIRTHSLPLDSNLTEAKKGWCQICKDEKLLESNATELKAKQTQHSNRLLENLYKEYSSNVQIQLQHKLN